MDLEKVTLYSSLALLGGFIAREIIKLKVRIHTMAIMRNRLQAFQDDETFKILHFNPFYDNVFLKKVLIELRAHKETTDETKEFMSSVPLEKTGKTELFDNQRNYSAYKLEKSKGDLKTVLDHFSDATEVIYILFKPVRYPDGNDYLAYELLGADASKHPIGKMGSIFLQPQAAYVAAQGSDSVYRPATAKALALTTSGTSGSIRMNPSPPATRNIST